MPQPSQKLRDHAPINLWIPHIGNTPITSIPHLHTILDFLNRHTTK